MQAAVEKGFKQATGAWGRELPSICKDTFYATNKLFVDYCGSAWSYGRALLQVRGWYNTDTASEAAVMIVKEEIPEQAEMVKES